MALHAGMGVGLDAVNLEYQDEDTKYYQKGDPERRSIWKVLEKNFVYCTLHLRVRKRN